MHLIRDIEFRARHSSMDSVLLVSRALLQVYKCTVVQKEPCSVLLVRRNLFLVYTNTFAYKDPCIVLLVSSPLLQVYTCTVVLISLEVYH